MTPETEETVDELLDLLHSIGRWFFGPFDRGQLQPAERLLNAFVSRILLSGRSQGMIREFRDRSGADRCGFCRKFCRFHPHDMVLKTYARRLAERAVEHHRSSTGLPRAPRRPAKLSAAPRPSRTPRRRTEPARSRSGQYLIWSPAAAALAGVENPEDALLVLIGRSSRSIGLPREELFHEAAALVGEPAASAFRTYARRAPRETARRLHELGYREFRDGTSIRYEYDAARMSEGWL